MSGVISNQVGKMKKTLWLSLLVVLALSERVLFDLGPNVEFITASMLLAAFYLGKSWSVWTIILTMFLSDAVLGNTNIFLFTWSGFLIPASVVGWFIREKKLSSGRKVLWGSLSGLGTTLFFYGWTNFGVWLLDAWGMYSRDLTGLVKCYVNGLPFLRVQLVSTLMFVPLGFLLTEIAIALLNKKRFEKSFFNQQART